MGKPYFFLKKHFQKVVIIGFKRDFRVLFFLCQKMLITPLLLKKNSNKNVISYKSDYKNFNVNLLKITVKKTLLLGVKKIPLSSLRQLECLICIVRIISMLDLIFQSRVHKVGEQFRNF